MTPTQREVLGFIRDYQFAHYGVSPSMLEIMAARGTTGRGAMHGMIERLERLGYIKRVYGSRRHMLITCEFELPGEGPMMWGCLSCARLLPNAETTTEKFTALTVTPVGAPAPKCRACGKTLHRIVWAGAIDPVTKRHPQPEGAAAHGENPIS